MSEEPVLSKYANNPYVRSLVQLIPNFGGAIDTILYEKGSKWRQDRLDCLLTSFNEKIESLSKNSIQLQEEIKKKIDSEDFYDIFIKCAQESTLESDRNKIQEYANILTSFLTLNNDDTYETELFFNITKEINQYEIGKLADVYQHEVKYYTTYQHRICDLLAYSPYYVFTGLNMTLGGSDEIPDKYVVSNQILFAFNRLEKYFLITIDRIKDHGGVPVNTRNYSGSLPYIEEIKFKITDFGKKYCEWIKIST